MRLQLASDLHLELLRHKFPEQGLITPAPGADLLVLAGDIGNGTQGVEMFANWPVPVLYVAGNHEFYGRSWEQTRCDLRQAARGTSVVVLDNEIASFDAFSEWSAVRAEELSRLRFFGATLWTDYRLHTGATSRQMMQAAELAIADHHRIRTQEGPFRASHAQADHELSRRWLERQLSQAFDGKTVVISHHAPHARSIHPRWLTPATMALNAAFVSDLSDLVEHTDLWLHGHVHDSFEYTVGRCTVVANPRGYARDTSAASRPQDLGYENPRFQSLLTIDV